MFKKTTKCCRHKPEVSCKCSCHEKKANGKKANGKKRYKWLAQERQAFADGVRNKAQTFTNRYKKTNKEACRKWKWDNP